MVIDPEGLWNAAMIGYWGELVGINPQGLVWVWDSFPRLLERWPPQKLLQPARWVLMMGDP